MNRLRCRLRFVDVWGLAAVEIRGRPVRAVLSAAGIALGVATMVAVLGISQSASAQLVAQIDALGTNLLTVTPNSFAQQSATLPSTAPAMVARIGPVVADAALGSVSASIYRNNRINSVDTQAVTVFAATTNLVSTTEASLSRGRFLNAATSHFPAVVLGADAASALGVDRADGTVQLWLANRWFTVVGILQPVALAPELDRSALIGFPEARTIANGAVLPAEIYVRTYPQSVASVAGVLPATVDPAAPQDVSVANPTDALTARADAAAAFQSLFLALGGVALLVGGVGIANVMVIAVLERRGEIGLRRAIGARRVHIGVQFVAEAALLSAIGGGVGAVLGGFATTIYASTRHWSAVVPFGVLVATCALAVFVGAVAGIYPALRAARLAPSEALRSI